MSVCQVHIPRTGGLALGEALRGAGVRSPGHMLRLSDTDDSVITIVRDPVARFLSAHDYTAEQQVLTIEELAQDPSRARTVLFDRQVTWLDIDRPLLWVGHTETLDADFARLRVLLGLPDDRRLPVGYNASHRRSTLSPEGVASVRSWYAADYELMERLDA